VQAPLLGWASAFRASTCKQVPRLWRCSAQPTNPPAQQGFSSWCPLALLATHAVLRAHDSLSSLGPPRLAAGPLVLWPWHARACPGMCWPWHARAGMPPLTLPCWPLPWRAGPQSMHQFPPVNRPVRAAVQAGPRALPRPARHLCSLRVHTPAYGQSA